eukprot:CAMPEP_0119306258 /NCGR_PEP_ID=MMETSP1333-20130426/7055_1 /TAXON_ID=418940 /ORGANISM="Scyphosphaera apsteinii, Strain RCC1455" /LENGTH=305 /DNA_ID=CAMNT_0007309515 /DNA_START=68 /DNA_END=982 /DNA_ORIENTATION=+
MPPARAGANARLVVPMHIADLDAMGAVLMPANVRSVILEIGCSNRNTMDEEELDFYPRSFLISFEPLLDKYALLLSKAQRRYYPNGETDQAVPLAHHAPRAVALPLAVSPKGGMITFNVSKVSGCSSMLPLNILSWWGGKACMNVIETRQVPSVTLSEVLKLAGPVLPIKRLKIDAQGMDFKLIASTPAADLERVEEIELEVLGDSTSRVPCSALYEGQERCSKVVANLASLGFVSTSACHPMHKAMVCERSMRFLRRQAAPLPLPARADVRLWRQKLQRGNCLPYVVTGYRGDCEYGSQGELFW